jgi:prephenate dehydrogenase
MISQLAILAPGLIGGSVARAARERGAAKRIVLWSRTAEARKALAAQPWCDLVAGTPEAAVGNADLVVVSAPVDAIVPLIREAAPGLRPGAVVTDVGSVKARIAREGREALAGAALFVGSHPMAGSEKTGWEHGSADLFKGRTCFVTPLPDTSPLAVDLVDAFWRRLGANVVLVDPRRHDEIVAHISHLPQVLASTLGSLLSQEDPAWLDHAGNGLRDMIRIAASDPELWSVIFAQNRDEVVEALREFRVELDAFEKALSEGDRTGVAALMARGKAYRDRPPLT